MLFRVLIISIICAFEYGAIGQEVIQTKAERFYQKGNRFLIEKKETKAIKWFQKCLEEDSNHIDAMLQLGEIAFNQNRWTKAQSLFKKATELDSSRSPTAWYRLCLIGWERLNYNLVKEACEMYLDLNPDNPKIVKEIRKYLRDAMFSLSVTDNDSSGKSIIPLDDRINTTSDEYFPSLTADGQKLVFTRRLNGQEDLVMSELISGKWSEIQNLSNLNTIYNEGAHSISFDGRSLLFTACNRSDGIGRCDIYISLLTNENWSKPVNLGKPVNSSHWESQPTLAPDGRTMYFSSDRPGGFGGKDLYITQWASGSWSEPDNLGPVINTPYDEEAPFIHADGVSFYFISNGHPGFGTSDIFYSRNNSGIWTKPKNLGHPINSRAKESRLHLSIDGMKGFLARERHGKKSDIFLVELPKSVRAIPSTYAKINIVKASDGSSTNGDVELYNLESGTKIFSRKNVVDELLICLPADKDYGLHIMKQGYTFYSQSFILTDINSFLRPYEIVASLIPVSQKESMSSMKIPLENIFFSFGSADLLPESKAELDLLFNFMAQNPGLKIKINGHTDNIGSPASNRLLSRERANAVLEYLVLKGIDRIRLAAEGFGDSQPLVSNETEDGRRKNRRTEFEIIAIK